MIAGAGMVYSASQQGSRTAGTIQGALGGASMGAQIGTYIEPGIGTAIGAVIGLIVGGVIGYFTSGTESPETRLAFGMRGGSYYSTSQSRGHQGMGPEEHEAYRGQIIAAFQEYKLGMREIMVSVFRDPDLFDLVGELPEFDTEGWMGMAAGEMASWLTGR